MKADLITIRTTCRVCDKNDLSPILSLGEQFVSDFVDHGGDDTKYPLELVLCNPESGGCGLLQLRHTVSHEHMYRNYWYRSGMNKTMTEELRGIAKKATEVARLNSGDYVLDIGANDGTLLRSYSVDGLHKIGFEPAKNLQQYAVEGNGKILNDFFNHKAWEGELGSKKAKAITAIGMFYDLEDPNQFVSDVAKTLDQEGVFIIQMSYLPLMLSENAFDNIVHEHLEYYSLLALENLLSRHSLEVFDVELNDVNGGSFRTYIRHKGFGKKLKIPVGASMRVEALRAYEEKEGFHKKTVYEAFVSRVEELKKKIVNFIEKEVSLGKKVHAYGASTKGNTLLQHYGLDFNKILAAAERNSDKWGKKTVGTLIPIISEEESRSLQPDYFLVLPWHFMREFQEREAEYLARGGKFLVPLPKALVISSDGEVEL